MPWRTVVSVGGGTDAASSTAPAVRPRRIVARLLLGIVAVVVLVVVLGALAGQRLAEQEAVNDAARIADVVAEAVVQPSLTTALADGDPAAVAAFDEVVRAHVLGSDVVRVKLWSPAGVVLYADEPELIGRTFPLDQDRRIALSQPQTRAEVSDLSDEENEFESGGRLLEVYRPVWVSDGRELLFEMYSTYAPVAERSADLWRGFAGVTISSLLLLLVLTSPIVWRLLRRLRENEVHRSALLQRAVDASDLERRRVAASLHDGPVQELVATSFVAEGAAASASAQGEVALSDEMHEVAASVRGNVRALRSLLVDIYPATLSAAGLGSAVTDLAGAARGRGVEVTVDIPDDAAGLSEQDQRLVYRVAQEGLRNTAAHAAPCRAAVRLRRDGADVVLDVSDDGPGFDPALLDDRPVGHFGTQIIADLAADGGASLAVRTSPGAGTAWRLSIPHPSGWPS